MAQTTIPARTLGMLNMPNLCPRCFWITVRCENKFPFQIPMPGIFNSIDAYGKKIIRAYFDRNGLLPPWFPDIGKVSSYVPGRSLHWSKFKVEDLKTEITLRGTPDDVFQLSDNSYHIVDYKTAKATEKQDELFPLYDVQTNVYAYISKVCGFSPISALSLIYMEPQTEFVSDDIANLISEDAFSLRFKATRKNIEARPDDMIPDLLRRARELCNRATPPEGRQNCNDCELLDRLLAVAQEN